MQILQLLVALLCENGKSNGRRGKTQMMEGTVITEQEVRNQTAMINDTILVAMCNGHQKMKKD